MEILGKTMWGSLFIGHPVHCIFSIHRKLNVNFCGNYSVNKISHLRESVLLTATIADKTNC
jgi:hypothetical protein